jgi:hypothetical protein
MMKTDHLQIFSWLVLLFVLGLAVNAVRTQRREMRICGDAWRRSIRRKRCRHASPGVRRQETIPRALSNGQPASETRMLRLFSTLGLWRQSATEVALTPSVILSVRTFWGRGHAATRWRARHLWARHLIEAERCLEHCVSVNEQ